MPFNKYCLLITVNGESSLFTVYWEKLADFLWPLGQIAPFQNFILTIGLLPKADLDVLGLLSLLSQ